MFDKESGDVIPLRPGMPTSVEEMTPEQRTQFESRNVDPTTLQSQAEIRKMQYVKSGLPIKEDIQALTEQGIETYGGHCAPGFCGPTRPELHCPFHGPLAQAAIDRSMSRHPAGGSSEGQMTKENKRKFRAAKSEFAQRQEEESIGLWDDGMVHESANSFLEFLGDINPFANSQAETAEAAKTPAPAPAPKPKPVKPLSTGPSTSPTLESDIQDRDQTLTSFVNMTSKKLPDWIEDARIQIRKDAHFPGDLTPPDSPDVDDQYDEMIQGRIQEAQMARGEDEDNDPTPSQVGEQGPPTTGYGMTHNPHLFPEDTDRSYGSGIPTEEHADQMHGKDISGMTDQQKRDWHRNEGGEHHFEREPEEEFDSAPEPSAPEPEDDMKGFRTHDYEPHEEHGTPEDLDFHLDTMHGMGNAGSYSRADQEHLHGVDTTVHTPDESEDDGQPSSWQEYQDLPSGGDDDFRQWEAEPEF